MRYSHFFRNALVTHCDTQSGSSCISFAGVLLHLRFMSQMRCNETYSGNSQRIVLMLIISLRGGGMGLSA